jgi:hypothetical protein
MESPVGSVDLFYDSGCGPCTLWARWSEGLARSHVRIHPLSSTTADLELARLSPERRFGFFHIVRGTEVLSGHEALVPLVGLVGGSSAERIVGRVGFLNRGVHAIYQRFWEYRRDHGCGVALLREE